MLTNEIILIKDYIFGAITENFNMHFNVLKALGLKLPNRMAKLKDEYSYL